MCGGSGGPHRVPGRSPCAGATLLLVRTLWRGMPTHESGPVELDREEREAFLGSGGTGVLAFSTEGADPPHSIPVSYGFDATDETFYFRLAVGPDREKVQYLDRGVSFVVHRRADDHWQSVVARGRLEDVDDEAIGTEALAGLGRSHIPMFDVFGRPTREVSFEFFRLVPTDLTGRRESAIQE